MTRPEAVLVVDDFPPNREVVSEMLRFAGVQVVDGAEDAESCLAALERRRYDVIVLDINLPRVSGIELCRRLRRDGQADGVRIVACTAMTHGISRDRYLREGFDELLIKPFQMQELLRVVGVQA